MEAKNGSLGDGFPVKSAFHFPLGSLYARLLERILHKFEHRISLPTWGLNEEDLVEAFLDHAFALMN
jgi:hypothetical protein